MTTLNPGTTPALRPRPNLGLTVLRVSTGAIFLMHGIQKFFTYTLPGTTGAFTQMGVPLPSVSAPLVAAVELIGGLALILGLGTRVAAALLAVNILVAILIVHLKAGFFSPNGFEFPLALLAASVALALSGGGAASVDRILKRR